VSLSRSFDGWDPEPVDQPAGPVEERRATRGGHLGTGTLACPSCDAPVALTDAPAAPHDPLYCPVCAHEGALRDFLSLAAPVRPAVVEVRVRLRP
jgi:hypothetical protein